MPRDEIIAKDCKVKVFDYYFANENSKRFNVVDSYVIFDVVRPYIGSLCISLSLSKITLSDIGVDVDYNIYADDAVIDQIIMDNIIFDEDCESLDFICDILQMTKDDLTVFFNELKKNASQLEDIQKLIRDVEDCYAEYYSANNFDDDNDDRYHQQKEDAACDEFYCRLKELNHE